MTDAQREALANEVRWNFSYPDYRAGYMEGEQAPAQPVVAENNQIAARNPIPQHLQTMSRQDLIAGMSQAWNDQAQELAFTYFNNNVIDDVAGVAGDDSTTLGTLTNMIRNYRVGPHADAPNEVRELAARRLEDLNTEARQDAAQIADALIEVYYADMDPEDARDAIYRDTRLLRQNGEDAWEDVVGPMAEEYRWNPNLQGYVIDGLRNYLRELGGGGNDGFAKGGMVKKKPSMALVVTRKNPELAEMAYQYGGMVR
jgi:hypothetical protein